MHREKFTISQIIPHHCLAVYEDKNEDGSEELIFDNCPVCALVIDESGQQFVIGLALQDWGYCDPRGTINFVGYAEDEEDAKIRYASS